MEKAAKWFLVSFYFCNMQSILSLRIHLPSAVVSLITINVLDIKGDVLCAAIEILCKSPLM